MKLQNVEYNSPKSAQHLNIKLKVKMYAELIGNCKNIGIKSLMGNKLKFIEWGTSKKAARPFLQPALERNKEAAKEIIKEELRRALGL